MLLPRWLQLSYLVGSYAFGSALPPLPVQPSVAHISLSLLGPSEILRNTSSVQVPTGNKNFKDKLLGLDLWPATPFQVVIPIATPPSADYTLRINSAHPVLPSELAVVAIISASNDMIDWIDNFRPLSESFVERPHTVIQDFNDSGIVTLDLVPGFGPRRLSRRLAVSGFEMIKILVERYGEAEIRFELWEGNTAKGRGRVNIRS